MEKDILEYIAKALEIKTPYPLELEPLDTTTYSGEYTYIEEVIKDIELKTYETLVLLLVKFAKMNTSN